MKYRWIATAVIAIVIFIWLLFPTLGGPTLPADTTIKCYGTNEAGRSVVCVCNGDDCERKIKALCKSNEGHGIGTDCE